VFLRKINPRRHRQSYGIHVGALAGWSAAQGDAEAKEILKEMGEHSSIARGKDSARYTQVVLFGAEEKKESPVIEELKSLNVDAMTPLEALNALAADEEEGGRG